MAERKYGPEDFLYYGQKVMVNPEMCTDNPTEPGEVGIVIESDIGDGRGIPYVLKDPTKIPNRTVIVRWEKSGTSGMQIKELLPIDEDVVPVKKYSTSNGTFIIVEGEMNERLNERLDEVMIQEKGEVWEILSFNENKRRELVKRAKEYHKIFDPDLPDLPFE